MKALFILLGVVVILAGGAVYYVAYLNAAPPTIFRLAEVKQDTVVSSIDATGSAEPEDLIDIGAQVTGRIQEFGIDPHDPKNASTIAATSTTGRCWPRSTRRSTKPRSTRRPPCWPTTRPIWWT